MNKKSIYIALVAAATMGLGSCTLDEFNPSAGSSTIESYDTWAGLQATCYSTLYHELYSKSDFQFISECGTDLWLNPAGTSYAPEVFYYSGLGVARQEPRKTWQQAYSVIATCNSVIDNKDNVNGGSAENKDILAAEAQVIRAFMHLTLATYFGPIPLCTNSVGENVTTAPVRNSLQEVYNSITSDLKAAAAVLKDAPFQGNYARVTKKTAYGLLARAYAQGAAEGLKEGDKTYWEKAKEISEGMLTSPTEYGLTGHELYQDVADMWAQDNNRANKNKEYLFVAAGLDANGTDAANAGSYFNATSQLYAYTRSEPNKLQDLYKTKYSENIYLGNHNQSGIMAPTLHALKVFADWDKRYENTFLTAYGEFTIDGTNTDVAKKTVTITTDMAKRYGWGEAKEEEVFSTVKDFDDDDELEAYVEQLQTQYPGATVDYSNFGGPTTYKFVVIQKTDCPAVGKKIYPYVCLATSDANGGKQYFAKGIYEKGGTGVVKPTKNALVVDMPLVPGEDRFAVYLSKNDLTKEQKMALAPCAVLNVSELYGDGSEYSTDFSEEMYVFDPEAKSGKTNANNIFPSMIKYNALYDGATRQLSTDGYPFRNPDIAIMRMAEIYLIAAEANVMLGQSGNAKQYIEKLQKRAIRPGFESQYVAPSSIDEQYILDEYAREFCGEHMRWAVLKRHRANGLFKKALNDYNKRAAAAFDENIHYCRPIPQLFLNQITNAAEFGDNGYGYIGTKGY